MDDVAGRRWRWVARSMALGAAYDAAFAAAILAATGWAAALLRLEVPPDPVYLRLNGVFLLLLAALYLLPALDPARYRGIVAVASAGRFLGFAFLAAAWVEGRPAAFLGLALGDLVFAAAHAVLLVRAGRSGRPAPTR
ncbi:MAG: hypothetical protein LAO51_17690 [Acidobacteriia bacterium]|nr:hypothetical protein [Terriglobia bacterium]